MARTKMSEQRETQKILDLLNKQYQRTVYEDKRAAIKNAIKAYEIVWDLDFE